MVEFVGLGGTSDNHRPAGLHAGKYTGASRRETLLERVTEGVDLAEQSEDLVFGCNKAADDDVLRNAKLARLEVKLLLDLVDALDERSDIDGQRLEPAALQDGAYVEQC